jgi:hypothetical protein
VFGAGVREPDPETMPIAGYRDELPTRLRLQSTADARLTISTRAADVGAR